tara:strand:+ start:188 stop:658 length:471 start_codon:yes stop_codon:yes gene_type:complete
MNYVEGEKLKKTIELYKQIQLINKDESVYFFSRLKYLESELKSYNSSNFIVLDKTKTEISIVYKSLLLRIEHKYIPDSLKVEYSYRREPSEIQKLIRSKVKSHLISKELLDAKILLKRKYGNISGYDKFALELNENILLQMEMNFIKENPEILTIS